MILDFLIFGTQILLLTYNYKKVIECLYDQYLQKWFSELRTMSKPLTYNVFKSKFAIEKYLSCNTNEKYRIALTRLRCSSHSLEMRLVGIIMIEQRGKIDYANYVI